MARNSPIAVSLAGVVAALAIAQDIQTDNTLKLDPKAPPPNAKVDDLAWLAGRWVGEGLGGTVEEVWSPPLGGGMMGMFRLVKDGKLVFSEHLFLVEKEGRVVMRLKHFDADFKGWEEKDETVDFPLLKLTPNEANFAGLTIRRPDADAVQMYVAIKNRKTGAVREEAFRYKRVKME
jgi:hypothetical protein